MNPFLPTPLRQTVTADGAARAVPPPVVEEAAAPLAVPLVIDGERDRAACQPVTLGVPFPKGALADPAALHLLDAEGWQVPLQTQPLARWPDGSVKWLLLDFVLPPGRAGRTAWRLRRGEEGQRRSGARTLLVGETPAAFVVDTGAATFHVSRAGAGLLARVLLAGADVLDARQTGLAFTDRKGRRVAPRVARAELDARGPVRATARLEGVFPGKKPLRWVARLCFFGGTGLVRVRLTVHNPERARHAGGLWDLGDAGSVLFRDLSLHVALRGAAAPRATFVAEPGQGPRSVAAGVVEIYQDSSGGDNWQSRNHVNRDGRVPCTFRGYRVRAGGEESHGLRASPVLALQGPAATLTAAVPEFWQQFPKAIEADGRLLRVRLFPGQFGDLFELQGGEQKTHTAWLHFGPAGAEPLACLDWVHQPACVHAAPEWYAASAAVPYLAPTLPDVDARLQPLLAGAVSGDNSLFARREVIDEYGWRNYGEIYADHEAAYYRGPAPVVSHYNNQYDAVFGSLLQFLRAGDARWFALAGPLARHVVDIDVYHTTRDKAAYNGGLFWHTDHYRDAATCSHRAYSRRNQPAGRPYGGGPCNEHNYTTGLLHYHYLTGDPDARAAVLGLADWVVNMEDGGRNVFGLFDGGPTGLSTGTARADYHGPGRGAGNSVNALLDGWLLTGHRHYLEQAERLVRRCVHPHDDVPARDLLNAELRWSYTVFLTALARYLHLKAEAGELDFAYAYARASLVHYARWMLENERPYFDRPGELEFPTETWAAQEFRKANVLRLAAAHADEVLRPRLLRRADELTERAWGDLERFPSRAVARALAILLTEGPRESCARALAAAPRPRGEYDFGRPEAFVPQRARVRARLKAPRGLALALLRLADVRRWARLLAPKKGVIDK